jgi:signal transduction histidine kinase
VPVVSCQLLNSSNSTDYKSGFDRSFRIYQQAVANIIRHAQASKFQIHFSLDDHSTQLKIEDKGCGFDIPQRLVGLVRKGHLGLVGGC